MLVVLGVGEVSPAGWAGPAELSVGLGEPPCGVVLEPVMVTTQGTQIPGRGGAFRPRDRVVQVRVLCGVLAAGEPAFPVPCADEVIERGRWPVGVPGMSDQ